MKASEKARANVERQLGCIPEPAFKYLLETGVIEEDAEPKDIEAALHDWMGFATLYADGLKLRARPSTRRHGGRHVQNRRYYPKCRERRLLQACLVDMAKAHAEVHGYRPIRWAQVATFFASHYGKKKLASSIKREYYRAREEYEASGGFLAHFPLLAKREVASMEQMLKDVEAQQETVARLSTEQSDPAYISLAEELQAIRNELQSTLNRLHTTVAEVNASKSSLASTKSGSAHIVSQGSGRETIL